MVEPTSVSGPRLRENLPEDKFEVVEVSTLQEAIRHIARSMPSLLLVSTEYGLGPIRSLCKGLENQALGIVFLVPTPTKQNVIEATRCGAIEVLVHPPEPAVIVPRIQRALVKSGKVLPQAVAGEASKLPLADKIADPRNRVEYVIQQAKDLLALPYAASAILRLCFQPDTSAADLEAPVQADSAITASVFRLANSVSIAGIHRVTNIRNAIARLGVKATANLALAQSVFNMFEKEGDSAGLARTGYWVHSLGTACCARALASRWKEVDPDEAFLAGLLHDIGKLLLDEYLADDYQHTLEYAAVEGKPLRLAERATLQIDHCWVGERLARQWKLPDILSRAIADHHSYAKLSKRQRKGEVVVREAESLPITRCTSLADQLAKAFGFGHAGDSLVETEALALWQDWDRVKLDVAKLYATACRDQREFINLLQISNEEFQCAPPECRPVRALLCFPEEEPRYRLLAAAFFVRHGYSPVTRTKFEGAPSEATSFAIGVTSALGTLDAAKEAADLLSRHVPVGIVFTDCPDVGKKGLKLSETVTALPQRLDFGVLDQLVADLAPTPFPS